MLEKMLEKKKLYAIILSAVIVVAVLVPVLILIRRRNGAPGQPALIILSPTDTTYFSESTNISINIGTQNIAVDAIWYRIYNITGDEWVNPNNITWTSLESRTLGQGGVYIIHVWVNNSAGTIWTANVTFTMIHLIIYDGGRVFTSGLDVEKYQKVIFQNGTFSYSGIHTTQVYGMCEMKNATHTGSLHSFNDAIVTMYDSHQTNNFYCENRTTFTAINSSISYVLNITHLESGSWIFDNNELSGTGSIGIPTITLMNSSITTLENRFVTENTAHLLISNSSLLNIYQYDSSNVTIFKSNFYNMYADSNGSVSIVNSTLNNMRLMNNNTAFFENVTISNYLYVMCHFFQGNNTAFNSTVIEGDSWSVPNLTLGQNVICTDLRYWYETWDQAILNLYNTDNIAIMYPREQSTVIAHFCEIWTANTYVNGNLTLYNSTAQTVYAYAYSNIKLINSTANSITLQQYANATLYNSSVDSIATSGSLPTNNITLFNSTVLTNLTIRHQSYAFIADASYVWSLDLYDTAGYYNSSDSTIVILNDQR